MTGPDHAPDPSLFAPPTWGRRPGTVLLIGFLEHENLGLGYLSASLRAAGHAVRVVDVETDEETLVEEVEAHRPDVVGFSLIFQFHVHRFRALAHALRAAGCRAHFTMGGHFPSLSPRDTLNLVPELDSIVRFEGEQTLVELVDHVVDGRDWQVVPGLAWWAGGDCQLSPNRRLLDDLDRLPYPDRGGARRLVLGRVIAPLVASRGCVRTCSFCSIHVFYRSARGKVVRTRRPEAVVAEMCWLFEERDARVFLFQDDDFPLAGPAWRRWVESFLRALHAAELPGRVIWKINCRADAVDAELFTRMKAAGLYLVYMGLESGAEEGLDTLHKQVTVAENLRAVEILREVGLAFHYGFMLLDPSTTFTSVHQNLDFLRRIVGDGAAAATFCRMLPYDGTPIKRTLVEEGRFRGDVQDPDYDFLDPRLDSFYGELQGLLRMCGWVHGHRALSPLLDHLWHEVQVAERLVPGLAALADHARTLRRVTAESNALLLDVVAALARRHGDGEGDVPAEQELVARCERWAAEAIQSREAFIAAEAANILRDLPADGDARPAGAATPA